jgi:hypothetical protein
MGKGLEPSLTRLLRSAIIEKSCRLDLQLFTVWRSIVMKIRIPKAKGRKTVAHYFSPAASKAMSTLVFINRLGGITPISRSRQTGSDTRRKHASDFLNIAQWRLEMTRISVTYGCVLIA